MSRVRLTAGLVETAKPAARDRFVWDTQVRGFGLKVTPAGGRIYVLQYRFHGRSRRTTIGRHGAPWTPHLARARARDLLGLVEAGRDPREAQRATHRSVAELCRLYLADGLAGKSPHALANARLSLDNHVIPRLGELEARLVGPAHVDRLQAQVAAGEVCDGAGPRVRGGRQAADAALAALSAVFGYAVRRGLVRRNPAEGIRRFRSRRVERYLSEADYARLGQVLAAAEALGVPSRTAVAAIRLIALAGLRPGEARALRWSDVRPDRSLWVEGGSGGRAAFVGEAAQAVIMGLPRVSPWLFPGRDGRRPCANLDPAWHQLRAAADLRDVRLIDLRHSFAAQAAGLGVEGPVLGRVMGLRQGETVARYPQVGHRALRAAAERICGEIAGLLGAPQAPPDPARPRAAARALLEAAASLRCISVAQAAARSGLCLDTLWRRRRDGVGPPYRRVGAHVVYPEEAFEVWLLGRAERGGSRRGEGPRAE